MLLSVGIVLFSLVIGSLIVVGGIIRVTETQLGQRLMTTARTIAEIPVIQKSIQEPDGWRVINPTAHKLKIVNDVTYIVVLNKDRVRYSDPLDKRIGTFYRGKDVEAAFAEHSYQQKVRGELGTALRAYVPLMDEHHQQVGVVLVGRVMPGVWEIMREERANIAITFFLSLLFGVWGSYQLARHMKKQMLNLEPDEIARILVERTATFHSMHEGVIAIDNQERITIFNDRAKQIFGLDEDLEVLGMPIRSVLHDTRLPEVLEQQKNFTNTEIHVGNTLLWSNRFLIKVENKVVGALAIFQDRTEVARMAEELTGVKEFVGALRVQNHEHMNKLHTIAGLLQLHQHEKALAYLFEVSDQQEELTSFLSSQIADENVSGLLMGKVSRGRELGIRVTIDRMSRLEQFPPYMDHHNFVLILGNLIENAFDSLEKSDRQDKEITISIEQDSEVCSLLVEDNGIGMDENTRARMLERGFSTKEREHRGLGLHLVHQLVKKGGGELVCHSRPNEGASFLITFPMKEVDE
ncbi:ATP-binding protein [Brevibacillus choshinensis]|uniref:histidine kinase n=1 Tax=Brevibacillus choshinensis TaxID=54911 RepID=A0ABX7FSW6_BRECH|nr:sensor histidine kinase [Brevibacillus choshinensis]QRG68840.1 sensor histidine kinase [Brevibacillus choshinensis]